jgi:hypothetical protein
MTVNDVSGGRLDRQCSREQLPFAQSRPCRKLLAGLAANFRPVDLALDAERELGCCDGVEGAD